MIDLRWYHWLRLTLWAVLLLWSCLLGARANAQVVISEVMWMGSDLSTSDEWLEIAGLPASGTGMSLVGWRVTSLNSSGKEVDIVIFGTGASIGSGELLVIGSLGPASSRLLDEPFLLSSTLSLPNTKLLLKLWNAHGTLVDIVDDGVGNPFAGANPSGGIKASMERVDAAGSGALMANWITATTKRGFHPDAMVLGTPGYENGTIDFEDSEDSEEFLVEPIAFTGALVRLMSGGLLRLHWVPSSSSGLLTQTLHFYPTLTTGEGSIVLASTASGFLSTNVDLNIHYRIELKSTFDFGITSSGVVINVSHDSTVATGTGSSGTGATGSDDHADSSDSSSSDTGTSTSGSSAASASGAVMAVTGTGVIACAQCSTTVIHSSSSSSVSQSLAGVSSSSFSYVAQSSSSSSSVSSAHANGAANAPLPSSSSVSSASALSSSSTCTISSLRWVKINEIYPKPATGDTRGEWIELYNTGNDTVELCGWFLDDMDGGSSPHNLNGRSIAAGQYLVITKSDTGLSLNDTGDAVRLLAPDAILNGMTISLKERRLSSAHVIDSLGYTHTYVSQSFARIGEEFFWTMEVTPGAQNRFPDLVASGLRTPANLVRVIDGDTIEVMIVQAGRLVERRLRMKGIDAPELQEKIQAVSYISDEAKDFVFDFIKEKKVELEFDAELEDAYGRLLAYVWVDGKSMERELLLKGYAWVYGDAAFRRREEFVGYEKVAKGKRVGIWSLSNEEDSYEIVDETLTYEEKEEQEMYPENVALSGAVVSAISADSFPKVYMSEVYPAPDSSKKGSGALLGEEWIELRNPTDETVDLRGWILDDEPQKGSKPFIFGDDYILAPQEYRIVPASLSKLSLKNDGEVVTLFSPDGREVDRLEYPAMKKGQSHGAIIRGGKVVGCALERPSPGKENECVQVQSKSFSSKSVAAKKVVKKTAVKKSLSSKKSASKKTASKKASTQSGSIMGNSLVASVSGAGTSVSGMMQGMGTVLFSGSCFMCGMVVGKKKWYNISDVRKRKITRPGKRAGSNTRVTSISSGRNG